MEYRVEFIDLVKSFVSEVALFLQRQPNRKVDKILLATAQQVASEKARISYGEVADRIVDAVRTHRQSRRRRRWESEARLYRALSTFEDGEIRLLMRHHPDGLPPSAGWDFGNFRKDIVEDFARRGLVREEEVKGTGWAWTDAAHDAVLFPAPPTPAEGWMLASPGVFVAR